MFKRNTAGCQWGKPYPSVLLGAMLYLLIAIMGCEQNKTMATGQEVVPSKTEAQEPAAAQPDKASEIFDGIHLKERACSQDADCVLVQANCCSCRAGGSKTAIHRQHLDNIKKRRVEACAEIMCPQVMSTVSSCMATTSKCAEGQCVPDMKHLNFPKKLPPLPRGVGVEKIQTP